MIKSFKINNKKIDLDLFLILNIILILVSIYIIYRIYYYHQKCKNINEGFANKVNKMMKRKRTKEKFSFDLSNYGYTNYKHYDKKLKEKFNKKYKKGKEKFTSKLYQLNNSKEKGKHDNFQNVLDEIDMMDTNAFSFNSMNNTVKRYAQNIDDRIKYAKNKNKDSKINSAWAQLGVLFSEGGKLFSWTSLI